MTGLKYPFKSRWRRATCHILPAFTAFMIGAFAIMAIDRNLPQEIIWGKIIPPTVVPGQLIEFHFNMRKFTDYGGTITRWVTDAHNQVFLLTDTPTVSDQIPVGGEHEVVKKFTVPCGMAVGSAQYHSTVYVYAWWNLVQRIFPVAHTITYPFTVTTGHSSTCALTGPPGPSAQ